MKFTMQLCTCKSYFNYLSKFLFIKIILLFTFREGGACNHIASLLYGIVDITDKKHTGKIAPTSKACVGLNHAVEIFPPKRLKI